MIVPLTCDLSLVQNLANVSSINRCSLLYAHTTATDDERYKEYPPHAATVSLGVKFSYNNDTQRANNTSSSCNTDLISIIFKFFQHLKEVIQLLVQRSALVNTGLRATFLALGV